MMERVKVRRRYAVTLAGVMLYMVRARVLLWMSAISVCVLKERF